MRKIIYLLLATTLFSFSYMDDAKKLQDGEFYTESDFIKQISDDCYLVNVRVYATILGHKTLVANEDVQVGSGCSGGANRKILNSEELSDCKKGFLPNGDYVIPNQTKNNPYCLLDLLQQNKDLYDSYLISVKQITSRF